MEPTNRPWWAPNIKGFLAIYALTLCGFILTLRMLMPLLYHDGKVPDDKILDIMTGVLFTTCLAGAFQYFFGSSARATTQELTQAKLVEKVADRVALPLGDRRD